MRRSFNYYGSRQKGAQLVVDEAIRSIKNIFLSTLVIYILWLSILPVAIEKIQLFQHSKDLYAWLYLREYFENLDAEIGNLNAFCEKKNTFLFETHDYDETIAGFQCAFEQPQGGGFVGDVPFEMDTVWPDLATYKIELVPMFLESTAEETVALEDIRVYQVRSMPKNPLLDQYNIIFVQECPTVLVYPQAVGVSQFKVLRTVENYKHQCAQMGVIGDFDASPVSWEEIRLYLLRYGFADSPQNLMSTHPALGELLAEADPRLRSGGVNILGINFSIGEFFALVGLILTTNAFILIGPLRSLRNVKERAHTSSWIMVLPKGSDALGNAIEILIIGVSVFWSLFPLVIIYLQYATAVDLAGVVVQWAIPLGTIGLLFSSVIFAVAVRELWLCRQKRS